MGNQNRITDDTMAKRKSTKGQTTIYKYTHKVKDRVTRTPLKPGLNSDAQETFF